MIHLIFYSATRTLYGLLEDVVRYVNSLNIFVMSVVVDVDKVVAYLFHLGLERSECYYPLNHSVFCLLDKVAGDQIGIWFECVVHLASWNISVCGRNNKNKSRQVLENTCLNHWENAGAYSATTFSAMEPRYAGQVLWEQLAATMQITATANKAMILFFIGKYNKFSKYLLP